MGGVLMLPGIFFIFYVIFSVIDFIRRVKEDNDLINQVERLEKDRSVLLDRIKDLEKDLKETKIERNVFRDFIDEFLNDSGEFDELVEVEDE